MQMTITMSHKKVKTNQFSCMLLINDQLSGGEICLANFISPQQMGRVRVIITCQKVIN